MKTVARDFTISIEVPDHIKPEDCEIVIMSVSASYLGSAGAYTKNDAEISIHSEDPYEM